MVFRVTKEFLGSISLEGLVVAGFVNYITSRRVQLAKPIQILTQTQ